MSLEWNEKRRYIFLVLKPCYRSGTENNIYFPDLLNRVTRVKGESNVYFPFLTLRVTRVNGESNVYFLSSKYAQVLLRHFQGINDILTRTGFNHKPSLTSLSPNSSFFKGPSRQVISICSYNFVHDLSEISSQSSVLTKFLQNDKFRKIR